jgi:hypothetical protein
MLGVCGMDLGGSIAYIMIQEAEKLGEGRYP